MIRLNPDQKRMMLVLCDADARGDGFIKLRVTLGADPIHETTTCTTLVERGLSVRLPDGRFCVTCEGYWLGDSLRIEDRRGEIPARRAGSA